MARKKQRLSMKQRLMNRCCCRIKNLEKKYALIKQAYYEAAKEISQEIQEQNQIVRALGGRRSKEYKRAVK